MKKSLKDLTLEEMKKISLDVMSNGIETSCDYWYNLKDSELDKLSAILYNVINEHFENAITKRENRKMKKELRQYDMIWEEYRKTKF